MVKVISLYDVPKLRSLLETANRGSPTPDSMNTVTTINSSPTSVSTRIMPVFRARPSAGEARSTVTVTVASFVPDVGVSVIQVSAQNSDHARVPPPVLVMVKAISLRAVPKLRSLAETANRGSLGGHPMARARQAPAITMAAPA